MGKYSPAPYKRKNKDGTWTLITPEPKEYTDIKSSVAPLQLRKDKRHFASKWDK